MIERSRLPPAADLEVLLRNITERLAAELGAPGSQAPDWSPLEWALARAVAAIHGVSSLLATVLPWSGPDEWCAFLEHQRRHTLERHRRLMELLERLHAAAREVGIPFVALKGAALHAAGLYEAGERPMADLDVLVRSAEADRFAALLRRLELAEAQQISSEREFVLRAAARPFGYLGEHRDNPVKIELHTNVAKRLGVQWIDLSPLLLSPARTGLNGYPSLPALMAHLLLHAAADITMQSLRLLQLNDLALVASIMSEADWDALMALQAGRTPWWAYPPVRLTERYFPGRVPAGVLERLAADCPMRLRRAYTQRGLARVSFSHVWVDAFPAIEWTSSLREGFHYALGRVVPSADHRRVRRVLRATRTGPRDWTHLPQIERIVRFVLQRPLRPGTLRVLEAALGEAS